MKIENKNPKSTSHLARVFRSFSLQHLAFSIFFAASVVQASAQVSTNSVPPENQTSFFQTVVTYFSSFNTNLDSTFAANRGTVWTGVDSIQGGGIPLANSLGVSYDVARPGSSTNAFGRIGLSLESVTRTGGVAGALVSEQAGAGVSFLVHDTRLTLYADAGTLLSGEKKFYGEVGLRVVKALSDHTFAGVGIAMQFPDNRQVFSAIIGFTF